MLIINGGVGQLLTLLEKEGSTLPTPNISLANLYLDLVSGLNC